MKRFIALFLLAASFAFATPVNVTRVGGLGSDASDLTTSLTVPTGKTLTATDGGTITYSGTGAINAKTLQTYTPATLPVSTAAQAALDDKLSITAAASAYQPLATNLTSWSAYTPASAPINDATQAQLGTKADMPRTEGRQNLRNFNKALYAWAQAPTTTRIVIGFYGDSVAQHVGGQFFNLLTSSIQRTDVPYPAVLNSVTSWTSTSGVTYNGAATANGVDQSIYDGTGGHVDFTYLPNGQHITLSDSQDETFDAGQALGLNECRVYLAKGPGFGSAQVDLINRNTSAVVATQTIDCSGASLTGTKAQFTGIDGTIQYKVKVTATGTVVSLATYFLRPYGLVPMALNMGGCTLAQNNYSNDAIFQYLMTDMGVSLIFVQAKEENASVSIPATMTRLAAITGADKFIVGSLPDSSSSATQQANNALFHDNAVASGYAYFDGYRAFGSYTANAGYTELTRLGWNGDGTHPINPANEFVARLIIGELGVQNFIGSYDTRTIDQRFITSRYISPFKYCFPDYYTGAPYDLITTSGGGTPGLARIQNINGIYFGPYGTYSGWVGYGTYGVEAKDSAGVSALVRGKNFQSTVATGTAPLIVASTTRVANLNVATAGAVDGLSVTAGKTLTASNTLTLTATDGSTLAIGTGGTLGTAAYTATTAYATAAQGTKSDNAGAVTGLIKSNGSAAFSAAVAGTDYLAPNTTPSGVVRLKGYTVSTLPSGTQGDTAFVTDALTPAFGATLVGGGAVVTKAFFDGTNWIAE